jgi:uncharacterized ferredoxin-like protein
MNQNLDDLFFSQVNEKKEEMNRLAKRFEEMARAKVSGVGGDFAILRRQAARIIYLQGI